MTLLISIVVDGQVFTVPAGITVAAALAYTDKQATRRSVAGQWRTPFCGMGICQECRVTINGLRRPACQTLCRENMRIERIQ
ncbi:2Fe-2S iron-sulfur cluster-binding protein [Sodalis sp. dw_96]|uniref:2Fe-2S iron-sulfur cluster-binding protein n=1 Tax=Sodalis sp. dw_96 TaxID=2719794 RepID=UPI001BD365D9|nr:2Fe-2S iron-sulfur cluster-binding protein [Sodalis sp. dw_96]